MAETLAIKQATSEASGALNDHSSSETIIVLDSAPTEGKPVGEFHGTSEISSIPNGSSISSSVAGKAINDPPKPSINILEATHPQSAQLQNGSVMPLATNVHDASKHHIPSSHSSQDETLLSSHTVRDVVLPLILKNANLRNGNVKNDSSESTQGAAQNVLTNEVCQSIAMQMVEVQKQLHEARLPPDVSNAFGNADGQHVPSTIPGNADAGSSHSSVSSTVVDKAAPPLNGTEKSSTQRMLGNGYAEGSRDFRGSPTKRRRLDTDAYSFSESPVSPRRGSTPNELLTRSRGQYNSIDGFTLPPTSPNNTQQARYAPSPHNSEPSRDQSEVPSYHSHSPPHRRGYSQSRSRSPPAFQSNGFHISQRSRSFACSSNTPTPAPSLTTGAPSTHDSSSASPRAMRQPNGKAHGHSSKPVSLSATYAPHLSSSPLNGEGDRDMSMSPTPRPEPRPALDEGRKTVALSSDIEMGSPHHESVEEKLAVEDAAPVLSSFTPIPACHRVPGIWGVGKGLEDPGILEFSFDIDIETAQKWSINMENTEKQASNENTKLAVHLLCLPLELVTSTLCNMHSADISKLWMSHHTWPAQGSLVVEINHGKLHGKTWLPHCLGSENTPLNITEAIQLGENKIRCIQLSSLKHLFAIHASITIAPEPVEEYNVSVDPPVELEMDITVDFG